MDWPEDSGRIRQGERRSVGAPQAENVADCVAKGRRARQDGVHNGRAKLTLADVAMIRTLAADGVTRAETADMFGVTPENISSIVHGKTWAAA